MRDFDQIYIDGAWVPSTGTGTIDVINASTEQVMGHIPDGTAADVDAAVAAATRAFETWGYSPREERAKYLQRLAEELLPRDGRSTWVHNQALMELGALVCTARVRHCDVCPVRSECATVRLDGESRGGRPARATRRLRPSP